MQMIGATESTMHGSSGGYTESSAICCGSNLRSVSGYDKSPMDQSVHPDRHDPMLDTDRPVRMVRAEKGRVRGKPLWK